MADKQLLFGDEIVINKDNRNDVEYFLKDYNSSIKPDGPLSWKLP